MRLVIIVGRVSFVSKIKTLGQKYLGIYIPLRLELLREINKDLALIERQRQFCFIFNCLAVNSFLGEVSAIIRNENISVSERLRLERNVIDGFCDRCSLPVNDQCQTLEDLIEEIDLLFLKIRVDWSLIDEKGGLLGRGLLEPVWNSLSCA